MPTIRIALIGAGSTGSAYHYPSLAEFPDVELVGVYDSVESRRHAVGERFRIGRRYTAFRTLLDETQPDAVYVVLPPQHLFEMVMECLDRRMHVFAEAPLAVTTYQAEMLARMASDRACVTMVGFNQRHDPLLNAALGGARHVGRVTHVGSAVFRGEQALTHSGVVDTLGGEVIHAVDMLRYLAGGKVVRTSSTVAACDSPVPNAWNALLAFDGGAVGVLQSNWNVGGRCHTYQVHSVGYSAFVEPQASLLEITRHDRRAFRTAAEVMGADDAADPRKLQGYYQQARHFVDCIQERRQPSTCFSDCVETMRVLDAIRAGFTV